MRARGRASSQSAGRDGATACRAPSHHSAAQPGPAAMPCHAMPCHAMICKTHQHSHGVERGLQ